jgi:hypothetical protein
MSSLKVLVEGWNVALETTFVTFAEESGDSRDRRKESSERGSGDGGKLVLRKDRGGGKSFNVDVNVDRELRTRVFG